MHPPGASSPCSVFVQVSYMLANFNPFILFKFRNTLTLNKHYNKKVRDISFLGMMHPPGASSPFSVSLSHILTNFNPFI